MHVVSSGTYVRNSYSPLSGVGEGVCGTSSGDGLDGVSVDFSESLELRESVRRV